MILLIEMLFCGSVSRAGCLGIWAQRDFGKFEVWAWEALPVLGVAHATVGWLGLICGHAVCGAEAGNS